MQNAFSPDLTTRMAKRFSSTVKGELPIPPTSLGHFRIWVGTCSSDKSAGLPVLIVLAKDKASAVRKNAVSSLGQLEGPGIWQSHSSDIDITEASSHDKRSPEAVGVIINAMRDDDKDVRSAASQSLTTLLPLDDSLITSLMVVTRYASDDAVIVALSRAFTTFGHKAAESQHFLIEVVKDKNVGASARAAAAEAVGFVSSDASTVVPVLTAVLAEAEEDEDFTESDKSLRISLIKALAHYGDEASPAMGALVNCLKTGESRDDERRAALQTLSLMGPSAVQAVTTAVEKHEQQVQEYKAKPKPTDMASLLASILPPGVSRDSLNRLMQLQQTANIVVRRIDGKDGQVTVGPRQIAIGLATWCPH